MQNYVHTSRHYGISFLSAQIRFARNLETHLQKSVKGDIHCVVHNDELTVRIYGTNGTAFYHKFENLYILMFNGVDSKTCAFEVLKRYRVFITNLYFL